MSEEDVGPGAPPKAAAAVREAGDPGNPGRLVADSVEACLEIAATWHAWDGQPIARTVDGKPNTWTPAKALRRITDHLIDHLQQVEALLAWGSTPPSGDTPDPDGPGTPRGPARLPIPPSLAWPASRQAPSRELAGVPSIPDTWHGRFVTLDADWARFTEADYDEACSRLRRLGRWYVLRYEAAGAAAWDEPRGGEWTLREIAEHVAGVRYYAEQVGSLAVLDPE
jgi:hypothetical protein